MTPRRPATRDVAIVRAVSRWFLVHQRPLPWRADDPVRGRGFRDPYRSLVSEIMLQQTQVARVLEKYEPFLQRFPTVQTLAHAAEEEVLAAWTGLGYYRRARLLHAGARAIVSEHNGHVPSRVDELRALPGVGRYTAGAVASMAHGVPAPIVDTNVVRVVLRVDGKDLPTPTALPYVWQRAEVLATSAHTQKGNSSGIFNEGIMELGAMVCVSGRPRCEACPLARSICVARVKGVEHRIPRAPTRKARTRLTYAVVVLRDVRGRFLLEQRPAEGLWANLWQPPTLELTLDATPPKLPALLKRLKLPGVRCATALTPFVFKTTHREVSLVPYAARAKTGRRLGQRRWVAPRNLADYAMSSPVRSILRSLIARD